jgi:hypothetical protein
MLKKNTMRVICKKNKGNCVFPSFFFSLGKFVATGSVDDAAKHCDVCTGWVEYVLVIAVESEFDV